MSDLRYLGKSPVEVSPIGVGAWAWGDKTFWNYGIDYDIADLESAFLTSIKAGINFLDTAEVYGRGESERIIGQFIRKHNTPVVISSKYFPYPTRFNVASLEKALNSSLDRLGLEKIDLYIIHIPYSLVKIEKLMDGLARLVKTGKVRAVGVSNYSAIQMRRAYARLATYDIPLAVNQVNYSLLHRKPEVNGVLEACQDLNVTLMAYSPLGQGLLTGKYFGPGSEKIFGPRRFTRNFQTVNFVMPVLEELKAIAEDHQKTCSQVALNWLMSKDNLILPIPGAKNEEQALDNAGALGWSLSPEELDRLDQISYPFLKSSVFFK